MKNQGYNFKHNYGHGNQFLANVLMMLMFLAFQIDQINEYQSAHSPLCRSTFPALVAVGHLLYC
ncbi:hypothetical protein WCLP8_550001 [uncultured Gammaproteobacteria bacterium]